MADMDQLALHRASPITQQFLQESFGASLARVPLHPQEKVSGFSMMSKHPVAGTFRVAPTGHGHADMPRSGTTRPAEHGHGADLTRHDMGAA